MSASPCSRAGFRGRRRLLDERGILLRHAVQLGHRGVDLADACGLFRRRRGDLADRDRNAPDRADDFGHGLARRGHQARAGLDPIDIHQSISALTFFNVSNQHTFGLIYQRDTQARQALRARRDNVVEMVLRFVRA